MNLRPPGYEPGELTELLHPASLDGTVPIPPDGGKADLVGCAFWLPPSRRGR